MNEQEITSLGGFGSSQNTLSEYSSSPTPELVNHHLRQIASVVAARQGCVCYVLGMGAQPKELYGQFDDVSGLDLVWSGTILKGPAKLVQSLVASHAGLIKLTDPQKLVEVVETVSAGSMAGVYVFDAELEASFMDLVRSNPSPDDYDFGIKADAAYFLYAVDADNGESPTGIYEIISYGTKATDFSSLF